MPESASAIRRFNSGRDSLAPDTPLSTYSANTFHPRRDAYSRKSDNCISGLCPFVVPARKVALRVNGVRVANARVRRSQKGRELVITDARLGEFVADDSFNLELLDLLHPHEIRNRLPNGGWRRVSLRILTALLGSGVVRVVEES